MISLSDWTDPQTDLRPDDYVCPEGFLYDYGGAIVLVLLILAFVISFYRQKRELNSVLSQEPIDS